MTPLFFWVVLIWIQDKTGTPEPQYEKPSTSDKHYAKQRYHSDSDDSDDLQFTSKRAESPLQVSFFSRDKIMDDYWYTFPMMIRIYFFLIGVRDQPIKIKQKSPKFLSQRISYRTLYTSVICSPISPPSLYCTIFIGNIETWREKKITINSFFWLEEIIFLMVPIISLSIKKYIFTEWNERFLLLKW